MSEDGVQIVPGGGDGEWVEDADRDEVMDSDPGSPPDHGMSSADWGEVLARDAEQLAFEPSDVPDDGPPELTVEEFGREILAGGADAAALLLEGIEPGPRLAELLSVLTPASLLPASMVSVVAATEKLASWVQARQHRWLAAFACPGVAAPIPGLREYASQPGQPLHQKSPNSAGRRMSTGPETDVGRNSDLPFSGSALHGDPAVNTVIRETAMKVAAAEVGAALHFSPIAAQRRVCRAVEFAVDLPATLRALEAGAIDRGRSLTIAERTQNLPVELRRRVEQAVLPKAVGRTAGQLRGIVDRAVIAVDPAAARKRHERAVSERNVTHRAAEDGMGVFRAELRADKAQLAYSVIDQLAYQLKRTVVCESDPRGVGALRSDVFSDLFDQLATTGTVTIRSTLHRRATKCESPGGSTETDMTCPTDSARSTGNANLVCETGPTGDTGPNGTNGPNGDKGPADTTWPTGNGLPVGDVSPVGGVSAVGDTDSVGGVSAVGGTDSVGGVSAVGDTDSVGGVSAVGGTDSVGGVSAMGGTDSVGGVSAVGDTDSAADLWLTGDGTPAAGDADPAANATPAGGSGRIAEADPLTASNRGNGEGKYSADWFAGDHSDGEHFSGEHIDGCECADGSGIPLPSVEPVGEQPPVDSNFSTVRECSGFSDFSDDPVRKNVGNALGTHQGRITHLNVTIAASTLAGLDDRPGDLDGHGPIPADLARAIAASAETITAIAIKPGCGTGLDLGRTIYRPRLALRDHVTTRDQTCRFPGCRRSSQRCQIDHSEEFCPERSDGGVTCPCNLQCLCAFHHGLKTGGLWDTIHHDDATVTWTSPTRRRYQTQPRQWPTDDDDRPIEPSGGGQVDDAATSTTSADRGDQGISGANGRTIPPEAPHDDDLPPF